MEAAELLTLLRLASEGGPAARAASSETISRCPLRRFFGFRTGVLNATLRPGSRIRYVGCPLASRSHWWDGYSYGEFRLGCSKNLESIFRQVNLTEPPQSYVGLIRQSRPVANPMRRETSGAV